MGEMQKVKIGFVGVGNMGQAAHLRHYAQVPGCEVAAIAEVRQDLAKKAAQKWGVARVYPRHTDMLANEKLDGIVAAQPFTRHGALIPELLAGGIPVLTEKPLAGSVETGEKIIAAMNAAGTWMMIAYHKRSDPAVMAAKREIERLRATNELGRLTYIRILMPAGDWVANGFCQNVGASDPMPPLEWDPPASDMDEAANKDYTAFVNYYIHQVNLMRHLLGEAWRPVHAAKNGTQLSGESAGGVACSLEMTPFQTTLDWQEHALVCFERGWLRVTLPAPLTTNRAGKLEIFRDPGNGATPKSEEWQMPWVGAMWQQARNFVAKLQGCHDDACCPAADALEDLKFAREYIRIWKGR